MTTLTNELVVVLPQLQSLFRASREVLEPKVRAERAQRVCSRAYSLVLQLRQAGLVHEAESLQTQLDFAETRLENFLKLHNLRHVEGWDS